MGRGGRGRGRGRKGAVVEKEQGGIVEAESSLAAADAPNSFVPQYAAGEFGCGSGGSTRDSKAGPKELQSKRRPLQTDGVDGEYDDATVRKICESIDAEVKVRTEAIKAIAAAQLLSITSQLRLLLSELPEHVQNMPLLEYLKSCPNVVAEVVDNERIEVRKGSSEDGVPGTSNKSLPDCPSGERCHPQNMAEKLSTPRVGLGDTAELSWTVYCAKLRELGDLSISTSDGVDTHPDSAMSSRTWRGVTPKTARVPKVGEMLLSLNGSPLGKFTPGPKTDDKANSHMDPNTTYTRSAMKRTLKDL